MSGSGDTYSVAITAPSTGSGNIELTLREDAVNEFNAETQGTVAYSPLPTATVTFNPPSVRGGRRTTATIEFSESVTGFTRADVSVNVGTLGPLSGSGDTYTVQITAPSTGSGNIELTLREDAINEFNAESTATIAYVPLPIATIIFPVPAVTPGADVVVEINWNEIVNGFTDADITVTGTGSTKGALTGVGRAFALTIHTSALGTGTIRVRIRRDVVAEGNVQTDATLDYVIQGQLAVTIRSGYPTRYVQEIGVDAPVDSNDYPVRFEWNRAAEGFDADDITVTGATLQSLKKLGPTFYEAIVRPPESGNSTISVSVRAGAVREGNNKTDATFAYTDGVATETLFDWNSVIPNIFADDSSGQQYGPVVGVLVEASRVRLLGNAQSMTKIFALLHDGTRLAAEDIAATANITARNLDVNLSRVNNMWFTNVQNQDTTGVRRDFFNSYWSYVGSRVWTDFDADDFGILGTDFGEAQSGLTGFGHANAAHSADINRWGLFFPSRYSGRVFAQNFAGMQQNITGITTDPFLGIPLVALGDRVYRGGSVYRVLSNSGAMVSVPGETLNISTPIATDFAVYGKWLYHTGSQTDTNLYRTDLEKYRAPAVRSRILPQFVVEGESLDLTLFASGAETILFESAYAAPAYLSIDSNLNVDVADGEILEDTCILVKLRAFSFRGDTPLEFYLVIEKKKRPEWKPIATLPIDNGETVNLFDLVENARRIAWQSGFQVPSGWTLTAGQLTVSNQTSETPVEIALTAFNDTGSRDHTFNVLPRVSGVITTSDIYDYRVLIEGLDVTDDLLEIPSVHQSLDVINPNEFVSDDASFTLSSDQGKYDGRVAGNFWEANGLNTNGYLSEIELWVDILDSADVQSKLLFQGLIIEVQSSINSVRAVVNCVDRTYTLKNTPVAAVGLEKYSALHRVSENYQGIYAPDAGMLPIGRESASVVSGFDNVPIQRHTNAPEAVAGEPACYITPNAVLVRGGYLPDDPLLKFKTPYRSRHIEYLIKQISEASGFFNAKVEINVASPAAEKHISSRGNVAFNIEKTKCTRTVVDWLHDHTGDIFYMLLSHPSGYIQDLLVSYIPASDSYKTLKTFDAGIQVAQLASDDFNTFYVLVTKASDFDRIESPDPPNHNEAVFDNLDSSRETEATRILKYVLSTDRQTTFVDGDDDYPAQIGLHYMAGFENPRHIRWREGIFAEARSTFRIYNNQLYYRYAKWNEFGVARATAGGSTTTLLSARRDDYFNMLNFDFDIAETGDVYMVYGEGAHTHGSLRVKKYDAVAGTDSIAFELSADVADLTALDTADGVYLGCHEAFYAHGRLYCVVPIQRVFENAAGVKLRDIRKTAGAILYCIDTKSLEVTELKRYDYGHLSCRSLTLHENNVYFAEYPNASTHFQPCNPDLEGWDSDARCNVVGPNKVWLKRVTGDGNTADVVSPWYAGLPFNATAVRMLSDGDRLHAIVRYADKFEISAVDSDASDPENEQWVTFGAEIPYYVEEVPTGSLYDAMVEFAKLGNARLQIAASRFRFVDVDPFEALCASAVSEIATRLNYKDANKAFPASGYMLVGNQEIIQYTGRGARQLTGLTRGVGGTDAVSHATGERVLFLDKVINQSSIDDPFSDINIRIDTNKFYNIVRDSENTAEAVDAESVARFGTRAYQTNLMLSDHQIPWRQFINAKTLNRLKDIKSVVRIRMHPAYYLDIGDIVTFAYAGEILMPIQIIDIQHTQTSGQNPRRETHIIGQEVTPLPRVSFGDATISDKTFTQYERIAAFTLPAASGTPKASYVYRLEGLSAGFTFNPKTRRVSGSADTTYAASALTYIVTDSENPTASARLTFNMAVNPSTFAFLGRQSDLVFARDKAVSEVLVGATGGTGQLMYALTGELAMGVTFNASGHRLTGTPTELHGPRDYTYRVRDENSTSRTQSFSIETVLAGLFYVLHPGPHIGKALAIDFNGNRQSGDDVTPADVFDNTRYVWGATASPTRIALLQGPSNPTDVTTVREVFIYDRSWNRITHEGTDLPTGQRWEAIAWQPEGYWLLLDGTEQKIIFYDAAWNAVASRQIDLSSAKRYTGLAVTPTRILVLERYPAGRFNSYTYQGTEMSSEHVGVGSLGVAGATSTPFGAFALDIPTSGSGLYLRKVDNDLNRVASGDINLSALTSITNFVRTGVNSVFALNEPSFLA